MIVQGIQQGITTGIHQRGAMPKFGAAGTPDGAQIALSIAWPSHQAGQIGLLFVESANETIATPTGWTQVGDSPQGTGTGAAAGSVRGAIFWKRANSNRMPAVTVADSGNHTYAVILTVNGGRVAGSPLDDTAGDTAASSTSVSIPGGTTLVPNCLIVSACFDAFDSGAARYSSPANAALTNVTERFDAGTSQGVGGGVGVITGGKAAAGTFGATTATLSNASAQARIMVAIRP